MLDTWIDFVMFSGKVHLKKTKGMVYFIHQEGDLKRFNIGYTTDISQRLMLLQKGTPNLLLIYKTLSNATKKQKKSCISCSHSIVSVVNGLRLTEI